MEKSNLTDISWLLNSLDILKDSETIVGFVDCAILIERRTEKGFSYRIADPITFKTYHLMSRKERLPSDRYGSLVSYTAKYGTFKTPLEMVGKTSNERAEKLLEEIFKQSLPKHGMNYREQQVSLSKAMLKALHSELIALCEAEVGTGKTHAYILALAIHNRFNKSNKSSVVATSTIALQKAITEEYVPSISQLLKNEKVITKDLQCVVRKGKSHYICDNKLLSYICSLSETRNQGKLIDTLSKLRKSDIVDLDEVNLSEYVKSKICVVKCVETCKYISHCKYQQFLENSKKMNCDYQIVNHNYLLADILRRNREDKPLLADYGSIIIDEAHKLPETIRSMYGVNFTSKEIPELMSRIQHILGKKFKQCQKLEDLNDELIKLYIDRKKYTDYRRYNVMMFCKIENIQESLMQFYQMKELLRIRDRQKVSNLLFAVKRLCKKLDNFKNFEDFIVWVEGDRSRQITITSLSKKLNDKINNDLWNLGVPIIMTSGTISINGDFTHLVKNVGLEQQGARLIKHTSSSPFDFVNNALLYLPKDMPFPKNRDSEYLEEIANKVNSIITATHGHTLILFTSYEMMENIYYEIKKRNLPFPLFMMGKNQLSKLSEFKNSTNGVLFASDSCGEGIDMAGDIVSSVIIVRLPFPIPNARSEHEILEAGAFERYLTDEIIPTMIIKLRQWIGRGIRREADSCVFSILDPRASDRYRTDILQALPPMPMTEDISDVERFIKKAKDAKYFK